MFRKIAPIVLLSGLFLGYGKAAPQSTLYLMAVAKPAGCTQPLSQTSFATTDTAAYLWFVVTGMSAGDVIATNYYTPSGVFYSAPSGSFPAATSSGDYCLTDAPFYIAGHTPGSTPGMWTVKVTANGTQIFSLSFNIVQKGSTFSISSLSPSSTPAGGSAFSLTVNGTGFLSGAFVLWNGTYLPSTFLSSTQVRGTVSASLLNNPGTASISVFNADGSTSNVLPFSISAGATATYGITRPQTPEPTDMCGNPTPSNTTFSTTDASAILWFHVSNVTGGDVLAVSFYSPNGQLYSDASYTTTIPSGVTGDCETRWLYIAGHNAASMPGNWTVKVTDNGNQIFSTSFTITQSGPGLSISTLSPTSAAAGGPAFTLTVTGTGFVSGASVLWNGLSLSTNYVSSTQLTATVPASVIASAGTATVTVANPGTAASSGATFTVSSTLRSGVFSHLAAGGGWTTVISLFNTTTAPVTVSVKLHAEDGTALSIPVTMTAQGNTQTITTSSPGGTINAYSTLQLSMGSGLSDLAVGWAEVLSSGPVNGFAIFRTASPNSPVSEGTVPLQTQFPSAVVVPFDNTAGSATGIALANLAASSATITATVYDQNGVLVATQPITIPASGHTSFGLAQQIPATAAKQGIIQFQTPASGGLGALGLRFSAYGTFTSVPVAGQ